MKTMNKIDKVTTNKQEYIDILFIADPSRPAIEKYLYKSDLFVMFENERPVCAACVQEVSKDTCELKNIAATKMRRGYGSKMIEYLCSYYKSKYKHMEVGTGNSSVVNIDFYKRNGFDFTHQIDNFFVDNYDEPIYEDGVQCKHMVMLKKRL